MQGVNVVVGIVAFLVVAGWAALAWLRHGRDPSYFDDSSILLPAPPPAMTAATATVVAGGGGHVAFMAALLDLASRDEIAFVSEGRNGRADRVGISFRGGESADPRVLLNRRNPIGEGETWLLGELKAWHALTANQGKGDDGLPPPEVMAAGMQMFASVLRAGMATTDGEDSYAARNAREHGLSSMAIPDLATLAHAYEAKTGKPMSDNARRGLERVMSGMSMVSDPQAVAQDPSKYVDMLASDTGHTMTAEQHQEAEARLAAWADKAAEQPSRPDYLPATEARRVQAPFMFATLLQTYARRHGWVGGLPLLASLRWHALGALEVVVGLAIVALGSSQAQEALRWLGGGIAAGGVATFIIGRAMPALSHEGAMMKAQLAAYRRTLAATFGQATSLEQVVATHQLPWLETPDQTLVWGIALGLRKEIEALLARTAQGPAGAGGSPATWVPAWFTSGAGGTMNAGAAATTPSSNPGPAPAAPEDPVAMFAGIEAIGSEATSSSTPTR